MGVSYKYGGPATMPEPLSCDACRLFENDLWLHPRLGLVLLTIGRCSDGLYICDKCDIEDALATGNGVSDE